MSKETSGFSIAANITEAVMDEADSYDETLEYANSQWRRHERSIQIYTGT